MSSFVRGSPAKVRAHAVDKLSASTIEAGAVKTSGMPVPVYGDENCLFRSMAFSTFGSESPWCETSPSTLRWLLDTDSDIDAPLDQMFYACTANGSKLQSLGKIDATMGAVRITSLLVVSMDPGTWSAAGWQAEN